MLTDITSLETSYLGKTVKVSETISPNQFLDQGETIEYTLDETDPVIVQLVEDAKQLPLTWIRFLLPDTFVTMEYVTSRLNVYIEKNNDTWQITRMAIG